MLKGDIITHNRNECNFPLEQVPKKMGDSEMKMEEFYYLKCFNKVRIGDSYPLFNIQKIVETTGGSPGDVSEEPVT